jgi:hypothetical protein
MVRIALLAWSCLALGSAAASWAQTLNLEPVAMIPERADVLRVNGSHAYLGAGQKLTVVDVTDPSKPAVRGAVTLPGPVQGIAFADSHAYIANGLPGLAIVDVSKPDTIAVAGSFKTPGEALRVAVTGTKAAVVNRASGLEVVDVSNRAKPVSLGSFYTEGYARDVAVSGALAYVIDSTTDLAIVDVSKSGPPSDISTQQLGAGTENIVIGPLAGSARGGTAAYVFGGGVLRIYDVADPSAPAKVAEYKLPGRPVVCGAPPCAGLAIAGARAYVAAGPEGVHVVDISDPANLKLAASYKTAGPARDVAVAGSHVFVAVGAAKSADGGGTGTPATVVVLRQSS